MYANLSNDSSQILTGNGSIVIIDNFQSVRGGRTLDVTGFTPDVINAGHVIIKETATGVHKPMPLNGGATAYTTLPTGHEYAGILISSILKTKPFAGILIRGTVNSNVAVQPFPIATILAAVKTALPLIDFRED